MSERGTSWDRTPRTLQQVRDFWIAEIRISPAMEQKIRSRRSLTGDDIRGACIPDRYERAGWHFHPVHGRRLLVEAATLGGVRIRVILEPVSVSEGIWRLRTVLRY